MEVPIAVEMLGQMIRHFLRTCQCNSFKDNLEIHDLQSKKSRTKGITVSSKIHVWKSKNQRKSIGRRATKISGISGFTLELGPWPYLLLQIRPASAVSACSQPATGAYTHTMTCPGKFFEIFESTVGGLPPLIPALYPSLPQDKFLAVQLVENK